MNLEETTSLLSRRTNLLSVIAERELSIKKFQASLNRNRRQLDIVEEQLVERGVEL